MDPDKLEQLSAFIEEQNENLAKVGTERSEQSFGLGCTIGLLPLGTMVLLLYIFRVLNIISGFFAVIVGFTALIGIAALVASSAKRRAIADSYNNYVKQAIDRYLREQQIDRGQFDQVAHETLSESAPLRAYITPPAPQEPAEA
jgi:hypothetical protein